MHAHLHLWPQEYHSCQVWTEQNPNRLWKKKLGRTNQNHKKDNARIKLFCVWKKTTLFIQITQHEEFKSQVWTLNKNLCMNICDALMKFDKLDRERKQTGEWPVRLKILKASQNWKKQVIDCYLLFEETPISSSITLPARYSQDSVQ